MSTATLTRTPFERRVEEARPSKGDINALIMDYLINAGYPSAAKRFAKEAGIAVTPEIVSIEDRVAIRDAIHAGDIQTAIEKINELDPQILDLNASLHFSLLRLQLIELIRKCTTPPNTDITEALTFATTHLAPRAPTHPKFLSDFEHTMALLIFSHDNLPAQLSELLDPALKKKVAIEVNEAILSSQGLPKEARIRGLVKLRSWAEEEARKKGLHLPKTIPLGLDNDEEEDGEDDAVNGSHSRRAHGAHGDAMQT
ncbi:hypothetical protein P152DRAFT_453434 [Eremomyces bilateralis CBS 781.70]|uniref:CTLH domain-containing protein n=1 Tax=Eremomyces bilateralis CBS 781.70 TaxID=1392243 RepID=A0A6G1GFP0_9PEZI|nr:uncharacterized protein P152DRAFT_453434 [Eremomyces bilateralis CBS 781.70]KAF1816812.1 hypothetical protein P152DRAFT_453434 [Eremomyces bilateralis CBS 781.70]